MAPGQYGSPASRWKLTSRGPAPSCAADEQSVWACRACKLTGFWRRRSLFFVYQQEGSISDRLASIEVMANRTKLGTYGVRVRSSQGHDKSRRLAPRAPGCHCDLFLGSGASVDPLLAQTDDLITWARGQILPAQRCGASAAGADSGVGASYPSTGAGASRGRWARIVAI